MATPSEELIKQTCPLMARSIKRLLNLESENKRKFLESIETNSENKTDTVTFKRPEEYRA